MTFLVEGKTFQGRTTNVSRGGLCADLADPIAIGSELQVDMQLVFEDEKVSEALRLPGRVVWCTDVDDGCQVGISFKPLGAELSQYLTMFLRFLQDDTKSQRSKRESTLDKKFG